MEFKPRCIIHAFTISSSVSSDTKENEYFTMSVLIIQLLLKGVALTGEQFYDKYTDDIWKFALTMEFRDLYCWTTDSRVTSWSSSSLCERCLIEQVSNLVTSSKICQMLIKLNWSNQTGQ